MSTAARSEVWACSPGSFWLPLHLRTLHRELRTPIPQGKFAEWRDWLSGASGLRLLLLCTDLGSFRSDWKAEFGAGLPSECSGSALSTSTNICNLGWTSPPPFAFYSTIYTPFTPIFHFGNINQKPGSVTQLIKYSGNQDTFCQRWTCSGWS